MSDALRESIAADIKAVVAADPTIAARLGATGQVVDVRGPAESAANIKSSTTRSRTSPRRLESRPRSECQVRTSNMSRLIELEPLDLRIEVRGRYSREKSTVTLMSPAPSERVIRPRS